MFHRHLESKTHAFAKWAGSSSGLLCALGSIFAWICVGEFYAFSSRWENALMIYIGIITFLMIFIIQRSQNKELTALHVKLNELIVSSTRADNSMIGVEKMTEKEISVVQDTHAQFVSDEIQQSK